MASICDFLIDILPTNPDKIQAWAAVGVLILTSIMACYAKQALVTWRNQKNYDIYIDIKQKLHPYRRSFGKYLTRYQMVCELDPAEDSKLTQLFNIQDQWFEELINLQIYSSFDIIEELPNIEIYEQLKKDFKFCKDKYDEINLILVFARRKEFDFEAFSITCSEKIKEISFSINMTKRTK